MSTDYQSMKKMKKQILGIIPLTASAFLSAACGTGQQETGAQRPFNIVHIMTDDHSYQTLSAYGHALGKLAPTPNLDKLAAQGMLFRQAFVENS